MMATHTVTMRLDASSIGKAIKEIEKYRDDLVNWLNELVRTLTEEGHEIAVMNVLQMDAFELGDLADSFTGIYDDASHIGIVKTDSPYAVFVEYGTGVVGARGSQHPNMALAGWAHDVHNHGDAGWHYLDKKQGYWRWTKGQESRPFFYNMYMELIRTAQQRFSSLKI